MSKPLADDFRVNAKAEQAVGGCNADGCANPLNAVEEYDSASNNWTAKAPMPTARYDLTAGFVKRIFRGVTMMWIHHAWTRSSCGFLGMDLGASAHRI